MGSTPKAPPIIVQICPDSCRKFAADLLVAGGVQPDRAAEVADALVLADLRGVDTHGINRIGGYIQRVKAGVVAPNAEMTITQNTPVIAHVDANNTFGFVAANKAIDLGIDMASIYGLGVVTVHHSNHYGMAATYLLRAISRGFGAMAFTNASRAMPPWGAKEPLLGTSPFAVGVPGGKEGDFIIDMSPTVAARGKIRKAARRGERIPEGYALDTEGRPTTDPEAALKGVLLPIGGAKGSGLATMMDVFGGVLTGANFAGNVKNQYEDFDQPSGVGHWFMVFRPELFLPMSKETQQGRMDHLLSTIRGLPRAAGVDRVYTSGEIEAETEKNRRADGIPFTQGEVEALHALARGLNLDMQLREMSG